AGQGERRALREASVADQRSEPRSSGLDGRRQDPWRIDRIADPESGARPRRVELLDPDVAFLVELRSEYADESLRDLRAAKSRSREGRNLRGDGARAEGRIHRD